MIVFVHDHRFYVDQDNVFSDKLPYSVWQRYCAISSELTVIGRVDSSDSNKMCARSDGVGVNFVFLEGVSNLKSLFAPPRDLCHVIQESISQSDLLVARLPSELGLLAISIARKLGKPYLVEVVGCAWDAAWNYGGLKAKIYAPLAYLRNRYAVRDAKYVSYVSAQFLQRRYPKNSDALSLVASNAHIPNLKKYDFQARLERLGGDKRVIGLIGSLRTRYKGVHTAIEALAKASKCRSNLFLRVLGDGDASEYKRLALQLGVADFVSFDGVRSSGDGVFAWLENVDIYIQPSFQEGVPRALIEAMACGCPALGSSAGGIPELLEQHSIFSPGDHAALARMILDRADDIEWLKSQSIRNFDKAREYGVGQLTSRRNAFYAMVKKQVGIV